VGRTSEAPEGQQRPLNVVRSAWQDLDAEELTTTETEGTQQTEFRRMVRRSAEHAVRTSRSPAPAVWIGLGVVVAVVVLAIVLYRLAPP
jgi:cytochrome c-type biogenesis protein CcmH/NrfG